jgi:hypothetical protein
MKRKRYDPKDPFSYPISDLAREAMRDRLEFGIIRGLLPADSAMYQAVLQALFPEDFQPRRGGGDAARRKLRRLRTAAFAARLERGL